MREVIPLTILAVIISCAGCGEKADDGQELATLKEQNKKAVARLESKYKAQIEKYEKRLRTYEAEIDALTRQRDVLEKSRAEEGLKVVKSPAVAGKIIKKSPVEQSVQSGGQPEASADTASLESAGPEETVQLLESFAKDHENFVQKENRDRYREDFNNYISRLKEQSANLPLVKRRENMLKSLQEKIDTAADDQEAELLERRMAKIEGAHEDDLEGILDYYDKLENNRELNQLMDEYSISRDELWEYGIDPPPRGSWRPNVADIALNLSNFADSYTHLTEEGERAQYTKDFSDLISGITARPSDAEALRRRDEELSALRNRYETASERGKRRLDRRMERLENSDLSRLKRRIQFDKLRELNNLAEKYDIPDEELRQSGVLVPRRRGSRF
jgi:hypothetical protein